jgi:hypothetical protein
MIMIICPPFTTTTHSIHTSLCEATTYKAAMQHTQQKNQPTCKVATYQTAANVGEKEKILTVSINSTYLDM